ncbi:MAG: trigger factor [Candidatus Omnitrophota bacterium]
MKVKVKSSAKCQKVLEIEVPQEAIKEEFNEFYKNLSKSAQVPGFRKGKAPRHILEKFYAAKAHEEVLTNLVNDSYKKAIEKEKINPVTFPEVSDVNFAQDGNLTFQTTIDVRPEFSLKGYKGVKIKKNSAVVKDDDIKQVLTFLQERYAQFTPVEDRAVTKGDYIICDYSYAVEEKVLEQKENAWIFVDDKMFIPGISKELSGVEAGQTKEFELKLPEHFRPEEFAKKSAKFCFSVKEIKQKKLPDLDDEFAKVVGQKSIDELKAHVKEDLTKEKEMQIKLDMKNQLVDALVQAMSFDVPPSLVKEREQLLKDKTRQKFKQQGFDDKQIEEEEKKLTEEFKTEALKQIKIYFILEEISKQEKISVTAQEMDQRLELIAKSYNQAKDELLKYLQEKKLLDNIHWELWEEKVITFLIDNASVEEKK